MLSLHSQSAIQLKKTSITMITEAFDDFFNFKTSFYGKTIYSLTQECTQPKGQKLSHGTQPQRHIEDQTHTYSTKGFHSEFEVLLLGTLGPPFTEPTTKAFFPLRPRGLKELAFSKTAGHSFSPLASPLLPSIRGSWNPFLK